MLLTSLILLLLSNAVIIRRDNSILYSRFAILIFLYISILSYDNLFYSFLEKGIGLYGGLFYTTWNTQIFHIFITILTSVILIFTSFYSRKTLNFSDNLMFFKNIIYIFAFKKILKSISASTKNITGEQYKIIEYPLIILFIIAGALFLISSSDLVSIFLCIELQSYGLYLLATLYRNSELSTTSGLTYFLLGSLSSCFILLGQSILYVNSGTTNLDNLFIIASISCLDNLDINNWLGKTIVILYWYKPYYIHFALLILSVGFLFKVSAAPFHFWSPDVYDGIPTIVTTFVAIIPKISIFIFFVELVYYTNKMFSEINFTWISSLLMSSLLSLIIGTVLGLSQSRIKRLYAYSTISHVGFMLLSLSIISIESLQAFFFYLMQYSISNLNAFILLIAIGFSLYAYINENISYLDLREKNNSPIQMISQLRGYFYINPVIALSLSMSLFSFIGLPPFLGFFAKQMVLSSALNSGYIFMSIIAILTSVISAVYYLVVIKQIFFDKPEYNKVINKLKPEYNKVINELKPNVLKNSDNNKFNKLWYWLHNNYSQKIILEEKKDLSIKYIALSSSLTNISSILTLIILLFMFIPEEWLRLVSILSFIIFNF